MRPRYAYDLNFGQLNRYARKALRRMRKRNSLVIAFWRQAELFLL